MPEARRYAYKYAVIDPVDNMCVQVLTRTLEADTIAHPEYIPISVYNEEYLFKYYDRTNDKWYEDVDFTIEWAPN